MKFLKTVSLFALVFSLQGCYQIVNGYDLERAIEKCGSLEEVQEITAEFTGRETVRCKNKTKSGRLE